MGRTEFPDLNFDYERALVGRLFQPERNGALFGVHGLVPLEMDLTPPGLGSSG